MTTQSRQSGLEKRLAQMRVQLWGVTTVIAGAGLFAMALIRRTSGSVPVAGGGTLMALLGLLAIMGVGSWVILAPQIRRVKVELADLELLMGFYLNALDKESARGPGIG